MTLPTSPSRVPVVADLDLSARRIAYFSMEIAVAPNMPTYSGGLGVLAGDTLRSAADTGLPLAAVTLLHRKGYFHQHLNLEGSQTEEDEPWEPENLLQPLEPLAAITIQGRPVMVRAWRKDIVGTDGHIVPVIFLDTDLDPNDAWDRQLTDHLYGGDTFYRLCQEAVLASPPSAVHRAERVDVQVPAERVERRTLRCRLDRSPMATFWMQASATSTRFGPNVSLPLTHQSLQAMTDSLSIRRVRYWVKNGPRRWRSLAVVTTAC